MLDYSDTIAKNAAGALHKTNGVWLDWQSRGYRFDSRLFYYHVTLYGHIKTAEQWTIIHQYGDWYTGR